MKKLNIGCGSEVLDDWINLDSVDQPGVDITFDLDTIPEKCLPFHDNEIDIFLLSHLLEHIENPLDLMEELWRVARPNARLIARVPHGGNDEAWIDPTHRRPYFPRSFAYFAQPKYHMFDYGYRGDWQCDTVYLASPLADERDVKHEQLLDAIHYQRNFCTEMVVVLRAVKPARARDPKLITGYHTLLRKSIPRDPGFFFEGNTTMQA
jgi:SAM-dependent methyltransferase